MLRIASPSLWFNFSASCSWSNELNGRVQKEQLSLSLWWLRLISAARPLFNLHKGGGGEGWGREDTDRGVFHLLSQVKVVCLFIYIFIFNRTKLSSLLLGRWIIVQLCTLVWVNDSNGVTVWIVAMSNLQIPGEDCHQQLRVLFLFSAIQKTGFCFSTEDLAGVKSVKGSRLVDGGSKGRWTF